MKALKIGLVGLAMCLQGATALVAAEAYNAVPADDAQFKACKVYSMNKWGGGGELSPIPGQSKAEAFCTCLWNETPDNFKGGLAKFSETEAGTALSKMCSKYSNWED